MLLTNALSRHVARRPGVAGSTSGSSSSGSARARARARLPIAGRRLITLSFGRPRRRFGGGSGSRGGEPAASDGGSRGSGVPCRRRQSWTPPAIRGCGPTELNGMSGTSEHGGATPSFVEGHSAAQRVALALFQTSPVRGSGVIGRRAYPGWSSIKGTRLETLSPRGPVFLSRSYRHRPRSVSRRRAC